MTPSISHGRHPCYQTSGSLTYFSSDTWEFCSTCLICAPLHGLRLREILDIAFEKRDCKYDSDHLSLCVFRCDEKKNDLTEDWWAVPNVLSACMLTHSRCWMRKPTAGTYKPTHSHPRSTMMDKSERRTCHCDYILHQSNSSFIK